MTNKNEKNKNIEKTKQNYNNLYDKLNEDNNYISRIKNLIKSEEEKKNFIDINRNKIPEISNQQILPISVSNVQDNNNNINYDTNLMVTTPKIDKGRLLNESFKIRKNNTLLLLKKKTKNSMIKSSSSFLNDDAGIKKRMEEISRFYSGNIKRKSGPVIISYFENNFSPKFNDKKNIILGEEKRSKLKLKKENNHKMKGRCLSAHRYDENDIKGLFDIYNFSYKNKEEINKYNNNNNLGLTSKRRIIFSNQKNMKNQNNNKQAKITINKFSPTTLFPSINNTSEKLN